MSFGMIDAIERAMSRPAEELHARLETLAELLRGITEQQKEIASLLGRLVELQTPASKVVKK